MNRPFSCGVFYGLKHGYLNKPGLLYRCILESITYNLYNGYLNLLSCNYIKPNRIEVIGGGANNKLWLQIIANIFQIPVSLVYNNINYNDICNNYNNYIGALGAAFQSMAVYLNKDVATFANEQRIYLELHIFNNNNNVIYPNNNLKDIYFNLYQNHIKLQNIISISQQWSSEY